MLRDSRRQTGGSWTLLLVNMAKTALGVSSEGRQVCVTCSGRDVPEVCKLNKPTKRQQAKTNRTLQGSMNLSLLTASGFWSVSPKVEGSRGGASSGGKHLKVLPAAITAVGWGETAGWCWENGPLASYYSSATCRGCLTGLKVGPSEV